MVAIIRDGHCIKVCDWGAHDNFLLRKLALTKELIAETGECKICFTGEHEIDRRRYFQQCSSHWLGYIATPQNCNHVRELCLHAASNSDGCGVLIEDSTEAEY